MVEILQVVVVVVVVVVVLVVVFYNTCYALFIYTVCTVHLV